jgi:hypothetical protein
MDSESIRSMVSRAGFIETRGVGGASMMSSTALGGSL